ncbi:DNA polymerase III, subunits gamma and tau [Gloeothece citriformis PCC 7424]|uniref:DNA polymerase III subunit gamma/tau n=1 Tax=Gloeothece citriformis (strain PCC 7424) TaxID=65393 RepID=B7K934_GLOC7|nr:DNA polymerase III subunit gamma/tau [Gloeothece citriformis]ACK72803.1 DNA polymerase III, subunits gamma and tau [Gloeothece citriformis PCC 7424]
MSYEPLHHKYRPQTFMDLVGQEAIAQTLINAITTNRIAPAYLFTGPRGTGKTSSARILAKSLNCLSSDKPTPIPCGTCEVCKAIARSSALDIIEIDAASNTGVDNIREIIERAQFAPVQCRYKVYVIDECHMLSVAAFNALLKTLEEPPNHVVFVLATTDPQRVLPTIISRCQRFDYRRIPLEDMVKHLKLIANKESIDIDDEAITLVAQIANGGLRDAESLLDQLSLLSGTITPARVWELVGAIPELDLLKLLKAIASKDPTHILDSCRHLMNRGKEPLTILQNLAGFYLNLVIAKTAPTRSDLVAVTASTWTQLCQEAQQWNLEEILQGQQHLKESEAQLKHTTQPRLWLEVTLLGLLSLGVVSKPSLEEKPVNGNNGKNGKGHHSSVQAPSISPNSQIISPPPQPKPEPKVDPVQESSPPQTTPEKPKTTEQNIQPSEDLEKLWHQVLDQVEPPATQALFSQQGHLISFDGSVAIIGVNSQNLFKLYQERISALETALKAIFQKFVKVNIQITNVNQAPEIPKETPSLNPISSRQIEPIKEVAQPQSTPSPDEEETFTNNGKSPQVDPPSSPEPESLSPSQEEITITQDEPEILDPVEENTLDESKNEINKACELLIKAFEGELIENQEIFLSEKSEMNIDKPLSNSPVTPIINTTPIPESNSEQIPDEIQEKNLSNDDIITLNESHDLVEIQTEQEAQNQEYKPQIIPEIKGRPDISNLPEDELDF